MTFINKGVFLGAIIFIHIPVIGQIPILDSLKESSDSLFLKRADNAIVYIRQVEGEILKFEESEKGKDIATFIAICATIISLLAIYLPVRNQRRADRRSTFFKMYEFWNSEFILNSRIELGGLLYEETQEHEMISLRKLRDKSRKRYHIYETVYDVLNDISILYKDNLIDRTLVKEMMAPFFRSYGNALKEKFEFYMSDDSYLIKMRPDFYKAVIDLRDEACIGE